MIRTALIMAKARGDPYLLQVQSECIIDQSVTLRNCERHAPHREGCESVDKT